MAFPELTKVGALPDRLGQHRKIEQRDARRQVPFRIAPIQLRHDVVGDQKTRRIIRQTREFGRITERAESQPLSQDHGAAVIPMARENAGKARLVAVEDAASALAEGKQRVRPDSRERLPVRRSLTGIRHDDQDARYRAQPFEGTQHVFVNGRPLGDDIDRRQHGPLPRLPGRIRHRTSSVSRDNNAPQPGLPDERPGIFCIP